MFECKKECVVEDGFGEGNSETAVGESSCLLEAGDGGLLRNREENLELTLSLGFS